MNALSLAMYALLLAMMGAAYGCFSKKLNILSWVCMLFVSIFSFIMVGMLAYAPREEALEFFFGSVIFAEIFWNFFILVGIISTVSALIGFILWSHGPTSELRPPRGGLE